MARSISKWLLLAALCVSVSLGCSTANEPPSAPQIQLQPENAKTADDLTILITTESEDPEGDPVSYVYQWSADGINQDGYYGQTTIPSEETSKGQSWKITVIPQDSQGNRGAFATASLTIQNTPPTGTVTLSPLAPTSRDDLSTAVTTEDADGDSVKMIFSWARNGTQQEEYDGLDVLPASATSKGQSWTVSAIPSDGGDSGEGDFVEATVDIGNSAPSLKQVQLSPEQPVAGDTLTLSFDTEEPDGDPVETTIVWFKNNEIIEGQSGQTLGPDFFQKNDNMYAELTPFDGELKGDTIKSNSMKVGNTAPIVEKITLSPSEGDELSTFSCIPEGWSDPDPADEESYLFQWYVQGEATVKTNTITGEFFDKGDKLYCEVIPTDGEDEGIKRISGTVTIQNRPPSMTRAEILPENGNSSDIFECSPVDPFDADDVDIITYNIKWFVNDAPSVTTATINGDYFDKGDALVCEITPSDNFNNGDTYTSQPRIVLNTPPSLESVTIDPTTGTEETTFSCSGEGWSDVDVGDAKAFLYQWLVNGIPVEEATKSTFDGSGFNKHDKVSCEMKAWDGEDAGIPVESGTAVITNTIPSIESVSITPEEGYETSTFTCSPQGWVDPDTEDDPSYDFTWYRQRLGTDEVPIANSETVDGSLFQKGDKLACKAIPKDEDTQGIDKKSPQITVLNSPPSANSVTILPETGTENTTFTCIPKGYSDPDPTDQVVFDYQWSVNGEAKGTAETINGEDFGKHDKITCTVVPTDGETPGEAVTSPETTILNTPPVLEKVVLFPDLIFKSSLITCVPFGWFDPDDGDSPDFAYEWKVNGEVVGAASTLSNSTFAKHDSVQCSAIPQDGDSSGDLYLSEEKVVYNSIPTMTEVAIEPPSGTIENDFKCVPVDLNDNDPGDLVELKYQWFINETYSVTTETLPSSEFQKGDKIYCSIIPNDDEETGTKKEALSLTVANALPTIENVTISPTEATEISVLECEASGISDPDLVLSPTVTYRWYVNDTMVLEGGTLDGTYFDRGDTVECKATARDVEEDGIPVASVSLSIFNTAPTVDAVAIEPALPTSADTLVATPSGWSDPDPDPEGYLYRWVVNDEVLEVNSQNLSPEFFSRGDSVYVVIFPDDGIASPMEQASANSAPVTIKNAKPAPAVVAISPAYPKPDEALVCEVVSEAIDADGDDFSYEIHWLRDGELTGFIGDSVAINTTMEGETWTCEMAGCDQEGCGISGTSEVFVTAMPVCGNAEIEGEEECDDGNTTPHDGCSEICLDDPMLGDRWNEHLVLWIPFDDEALDLSNSSHTVQNTDASAGEDRFGSSNKAYVFNGDSYLQIPASEQFDFDEDDFTISLWVKPVGDLTENTVISRWATGSAGNVQDAFSLNFFDSSANSATLKWLHTQDGSSDQITNMSPEIDGKWMHIIVRKVENSLSIYRDMQQIGSKNISGISSSNLPLTIGASANFEDRFNGAIDDIAIWTRALSDEEMLALYEADGYVPPQDETESGE